MTTIVSVDLAYKKYSDIGIVLLSDIDKTIHIDLIKSNTLGLEGTPNPVYLAKALLRLCHQKESLVLMLDGPQAWKDPENGLNHSRICERKLNTPAKTGLPGLVKPRNYKPFVVFSIELFSVLQQYSAKLLWTKEDRPFNKVIILESFPFSAWKGLSIKPLPSKRRATISDMLDRIQRLQEIYRLVINGEPTHDELQAIVAGLAGIAFLKQTHEEYEIVGAQPRMIEGVLREGFIVNPKKRSR